MRTARPESEGPALLGPGCGHDAIATPSDAGMLGAAGTLELAGLVGAAGHGGWPRRLWPTSRPFVEDVAEATDCAG